MKRRPSGADEGAVGGLWPAADKLAREEILDPPRAVRAGYTPLQTDTRTRGLDTSWPLIISHRHRVSDTRVRRMGRWPLASSNDARRGGCRKCDRSGRQTGRRIVRCPGSEPFARFLTIDT